MLQFPNLDIASRILVYADLNSGISLLQTCKLLNSSFSLWFILLRQQNASRHLAYPPNDNFSESSLVELQQVAYTTRRLFARFTSSADSPDGAKSSIRSLKKIRLRRSHPVTRTYPGQEGRFDTYTLESLLVVIPGTGLVLTKFETAEADDDVKPKCVITCWDTRRSYSSGSDGSELRVGSVELDPIPVASPNLYVYTAIQRKCFLPLACRMEGTSSEITIVVICIDWSTRDAPVISIVNQFGAVCRGEAVQSLVTLRNGSHLALIGQSSIGQSSTKFWIGLFPLETDAPQHDTGPLQIDPFEMPQGRIILHRVFFHKDSLFFISIDNLGTGWQYRYFHLSLQNASHLIPTALSGGVASSSLHLPMTPTHEDVYSAWTEHSCLHQSSDTVLLRTLSSTYHATTQRFESITSMTFIPFQVTTHKELVVRCTLRDESYTATISRRQEQAYPRGDELRWVRGWSDRHILCLSVPGNDVPIPLTAMSLYTMADLDPHRAETPWWTRELELPEGIKLGDYRGNTTALDEHLGLVFLATQEDDADPTELCILSYI